MTKTEEQPLQDFEIFLRNLKEGTEKSIRSDGFLLFTGKTKGENVESDMAIIGKTQVIELLIKIIPTYLQRWAIQEAQTAKLKEESSNPNKVIN